VKLRVTKPIVLVGMMGSGKSTIGKKLSRKLNLQFYDSDKVIEDREGLSIVDIHDFRGKDYFREKELEIIDEIMKYGIVILSTGGSSMLSEGVRDILEEKAVTIWLKTDIDTLYERVSRRNTRPELNYGDKKVVLEELNKEQEPHFENSDIIIEAKDIDAHYIVDSIMIKLKDIFDWH
jgi:shikimate kinase